jgi:Catalase
MQGTFKLDPAARSITKAKLFTSQETTVLARFSDFTGIPTIPDNTMDANPRGMAVKFNVPDDSEVDVVMHSFDGFPTRTSAEFRELLIAVGTSGKGVPKPPPVDTFLTSHPIAKTFLTTQKPPPVSYATTAFFGVNSLKFTNSQGQSTYVRYLSSQRPVSIISMPLHLGPRTQTICKPRSRRGSTRCRHLYYLVRPGCGTGRRHRRSIHRVAGKAHVGQTRRGALGLPPAGAHRDCRQTCPAAVD